MSLVHLHNLAPTKVAQGWSMPRIYVGVVFRVKPVQDIGVGIVPTEHVTGLLAILGRDPWREGVVPRDLKRYKYNTGSASDQRIAVWPLDDILRLTPTCETEADYLAYAWLMGVLRDHRIVVVMPDQWLCLSSN